MHVKNYRYALMAIATALIGYTIASANVQAQAPVGPIGGDTFAPIILQGTTGGSDPLDVQINWFSHDIGDENFFAIIFRDAQSGEDLYDVEFDFSVLQGGQELARFSITEPAPQGQAHSVQHSFTSAGSYVIRIDNINGTDESVEFPVQVTPEFHVAFLVVAVAAIMGGIAIAGRLRMLPQA